MASLIGRTLVGRLAAAARFPPHTAFKTAVNSMSTTQRRLIGTSGCVNSSSLSAVGESESKPDNSDSNKSKKAAKEFTNVAGLTEFFDKPDNFGEPNVKHGRSWTLDELRIKSNADLHRLWFVLLKERNMLLTLAAEARRDCQAMPSPERLDKVEDSMERLEAVVRERNKAYFDLEVGECGERPRAAKQNWMGLVNQVRLSEHWMPQRYNASHNQKYPLPFNDKAQTWFLNHYREVRQGTKLHLQRKANREVLLQLRKFPDVDTELLKQKYPNVDVDYLRNRLDEKLA